MNGLGLLVNKLPAAIIKEVDSQGVCRRMERLFYWGFIFEKGLSFLKELLEKLCFESCVVNDFSVVTCAANVFIRKYLGRQKKTQL